MHKDLVFDCIVILNDSHYTIETTAKDLEALQNHIKKINGQSG